MYSSRLEKLGIYSLEDFLYHIPFRYDDFSLVSKISAIQPGEIVTVKGQVKSIKNIYTKYGKNIQKAEVADETGSIEIVWFNQTYLTKNIKTGDFISLSGKIDFFNRKSTFISPEYELINDTNKQLHTGRLIPVYPETKGVSSKWLRKQVHTLLTEFKSEIKDFLPRNILEKYNYLDLYDAFSQIHFPDNINKANQARERLAFNELFLIQLKSKIRKKEWEKELLGFKFSVKEYKYQLEKTIKSLPFKLTQSQTQVLNEVLNDLTHEKPMNRLLQGDVGSGKTIIGILAIYLAHLNGFQSVIMAPTEILAEQHFNTVKKFLSPLGLKIALTTGSKKIGFKKQDLRNKNKTELTENSYILNQESSFDVLIGTHAVLSERIKFKKLGLVIIDEQQRFGVEQRSIIRQKGNNPHFLTMTATPIPRTVALTMYGDLDISYLTDMPKGRKQIKTWLVPTEKRDSAYVWMRKEILKLKSQIFIICPFIEESESMQSVKAAKVEFERLKTEVFPDLKLNILHGKQKAKEKEQILSDFREKKFDILVATPVVEVGIDIPNATVIVIEAAERFGLAQLHQMRGRVGRGGKQSYCLLFTESPSIHTVTRLKTMESNNNGADLAELDLKLRGPGDVFGTAQSGLPKLKIANFSDFSLIQKTKYEAEHISESLSNFPKLQEKLNDLTLTKVSPD